MINKKLFSKIIVIFWSFWWLIALWTDIVGGLAHLGILNATWAPNTNYPFLKESLLKMYHLHDCIPPTLFIGIIISSFTTTILFFHASIQMCKTKNYSQWARHVDYAFIFSLSFWFILFLADQCIMQFDLEANHMIQGGFELLTYFFVLFTHEFSVISESKT